MKILLLGSGDGKEIYNRCTTHQQIIAVDSYENAPCKLPMILKSSIC
jgi:formate-dependent phosphoribosylglycinamide formyltransferase (GAR transformylase)